MRASDIRVGLRIEPAGARVGEGVRVRHIRLDVEDGRAVEHVERVDLQRQAVGAQQPQQAAALAERIERETGLRARTRDEFAQDGIDFIIENTGIPLNFGITVALGFVVGVAIVGLTFSLFIRDNIKQFGALKAIGVTNGNIRRMVAAQAGLVGLAGCLVL